MARTNLIYPSEDFTSGNWQNVQSTDSGDVIANPVNGQVTADELIDNTATSTAHYVRNTTPSITIGNNYLFSLYCRQNTLGYCALYMDGPNDGKYFDFVTGAVGGNLIGAPVNAGIIDEGSGWYRAYIEAVATATTNGFRVYLSPDGSSYLYTGTGQGLYVFGAMVEDITGNSGAAPSKYIKTVDSAVTVQDNMAQGAGLSFGKLGKLGIR